jgi:hypothetical protein
MIHPAMDSAVSAENASRFQQPLGKPSGFPTDSTTTTTTRYSTCPPKRGRSTFPMGGRINLCDLWAVLCVLCTSVVVLPELLLYIFQMGNEGFGEFVAEAEVTSDAVGVEVVVVNACGHDGDTPEFFCESGGDTTRNRLFLVGRYGQH